MRYEVKCQWCHRVIASGLGELANWEIPHGRCWSFAVLITWFQEQP